MKIGRYLFSVVLFGALAFAVVSLHMEQVEAGYQIRQHEGEITSLMEEIRNLQISREIALHPDVLRARAEKFGIDLVPLVPTPEPK